jgi:hypothetical protein
MSRLQSHANELIKVIDDLLSAINDDIVHIGLHIGLT